MPKKGEFIPLSDRFWKFVDKSSKQIQKHVTEPCWLWTGAIINGYGKTSDNGEHMYAHRASYRMAYGDFDEDLRVCHKCDIRNCVRPIHLHLDTQKWNMCDASSKGRMAVGDKNGSRLYPDRLVRGEKNISTMYPEIRRGENNGNAKLREEDAIAIRVLHESGVSGASIGRMYGINKTTALNIAHRKLWRHVQ
jgi:hypothetical protein